MTLGEEVEVEEDLLFGVLWRAAAIDGVLAAFEGARVVFEAAKSVGDGEIGLQDAAEHFLVERFLERFGGFQVGGGVVVFGVEVGDDARVLFVAEPGVVVDAAVVVNDVLDGLTKGDGRLETGGPGPGGRRRFREPGVRGQISGSGIEFGGHFGFRCVRDRAKGIVK